MGEFWTLTSLKDYPHFGPLCQPLTWKMFMVVSVWKMRLKYRLLWCSPTLFILHKIQLCSLHGTMKMSYNVQWHLLQKNGGYYLSSHDYCSQLLFFSYNWIINIIMLATPKFNVCRPLSILTIIKFGTPSLGKNLSIMQATSNKPCN